jgi:hypothetical protein
VGSAEDEKYDQTLDSVLVGPVVPGSYRFVFQADPPDPSKIPSSDVVGVTVLLLTCSYRDKEFIRVGYYVNTEYDSEELRENPPEPVQLDKCVLHLPSQAKSLSRRVSVARRLFSCTLASARGPMHTAVVRLACRAGGAHAGATSGLAEVAPNACAPSVVSTRRFYETKHRRR